MPPPGIEPGSDALQAPAMTTFAKAAWCSQQESNLWYILTKDVLCHLTMRAWYLLTESNCRNRRVKTKFYHWTKEVFLGVTSWSRTNNMISTESGVTATLWPHWIRSGYGSGALYRVADYTLNIARSRVRHRLLGPHSCRSYEKSQNWSGIPESNWWLNLGKVSFYH